MHEETIVPFVRRLKSTKDQLLCQRSLARLPHACPRMTSRTLSFNHTGYTDSAVCNAFMSMSYSNM